MFLVLLYAKKICTTFVDVFKKVNFFPHFHPPIDNERQN